MTALRRRTALAAAALNRQRARRVEVPSAHDPDRLLRVARSVLEVSERFGLGAPTGEEYAATGWHSRIADRAQDFEGGTIYLNAATAHAGFLRWRAYEPITHGGPVEPPDGPIGDRQGGSFAREVSGW